MNVGRQHYHGLVGPWAGWSAIEMSTASARAIRPHRSRMASVVVVVLLVECMVTLGWTERRHLGCKVLPVSGVNGIADQLWPSFSLVHARRGNTCMHTTGTSSTGTSSFPLMWSIDMCRRSQRRGLFEDELRRRDAGGDSNHRDDEWCRGDRRRGCINDGGVPCGEFSISSRSIRDDESMQVPHVRSERQHAKGLCRCTNLGYR